MMDPTAEELEAMLATELSNESRMHLIDGNLIVRLIHALQSARMRAEAAEAQLVEYKAKGAAHIRMLAENNDALRAQVARLVAILEGEHPYASNGQFHVGEEGCHCRRDAVAAVRGQER